MTKKTKCFLLALTAAAVLVFLVMLPARIGGKRVTYAEMLMVDDVLYVCTHEPIEEEIGEDSVLGYTTSYTEKEPRKNGQTNIGYEIPYAIMEDGLAVQMREQ